MVCTSFSNIVQSILILHLALPFLNHTKLLLSPLVVCGVLWFVSLFGFNVPRHFGPILVIGARFQ